MEEIKTNGIYVVYCRLKTNEFQEAILNKRFIAGDNMFNNLARKMIKRFNKMNSNKDYLQLLDEIKVIETKWKQTTDKKAKDKLNKERNQLLKIKNEFIKEYQLTKFDVINSMLEFSNYFRLVDTQTAKSIAADVLRSLTKMIDGESKKVKLRKFGDTSYVHAESNKQGIRYRDGKILWGDKSTKLSLVLDLPKHKKSNEYFTNGFLNKQDKLKYCGIKRKFVRGKFRYFVVFTMTGLPPNLKPMGNETIGLDIGTSSIAVVSDTKVILNELAPNIKYIETELARTHRQMDRSRRAMNPDNYNPNGTCKKGPKHWNNSKKYLKLKAKRQEIYRRLQVQREQSHNQLANQLIELGGTIKVEKMNFAGLAKRSKKSKINPKTGRYRSKKRYGKSISNRAPGLLLAIIDKKLKYRCKELIKINTWKIKASQYNPITDEYLKKDLNERWNDFEYKGQSVLIQRDLMSAFVIQNVVDDQVDSGSCLNKFDQFKKAHNLEINRLRKLNTRPGCFGF